MNFVTLCRPKLQLAAVKKKQFLLKQVQQTVMTQRDKTCDSRRQQSNEKKTYRESIIIRIEVHSWHNPMSLRIFYNFVSLFLCCSSATIKNCNYSRNSRYISLKIHRKCKFFLQTNEHSLQWVKENTQTVFQCLRLLFLLLFPSLTRVVDFELCSATALHTNTPKTNIFAHTNANGF